MTPLLVAKLIVEVGWPLAQQIIQWHNAQKDTVTDADIKELNALAAKTADEYLAEAGGAPR